VQVRDCIATARTQDAHCPQITAGASSLKGRGDDPSHLRTMTHPVSVWDFRPNMAAGVRI